MMNRFSRRVVLYTGWERTAPVVFYEVRTEAGYRNLVSHVLNKNPRWEFSTDWNAARFNRFRRELLERGIPCPHFRETASGTWTQVIDPKWPLAQSSQEARVFTPSLS